MSIATCAQSLLHIGRCCVCDEPATVAILIPVGDGEGLQECSRCDEHGSPGGALAVKPFQAAPGWAPT